MHLLAQHVNEIGMLLGMFFYVLKEMVCFEVIFLVGKL